MCRSSGNKGAYRIPRLFLPAQVATARRSFPGHLARITCAGVSAQGRRDARNYKLRHYDQDSVLARRVLAVQRVAGPLPHPLLERPAMQAARVIPSPSESQLPIPAPQGPKALRLPAVRGLKKPPRHVEIDNDLKGVVKAVNLRQFLYDAQEHWALWRILAMGVIAVVVLNLAFAGYGNKVFMGFV